MPTVSEIQRCVGSYFDLTIVEMRSAYRGRRVVRPRQIGMYLCRQLTIRSFPEIARAFGKEDHTTVIHAVRSIINLIATDCDVAEAVRELEEKIENGEGIFRGDAGRPGWGESLHVS